MGVLQTDKREEYKEEFEAMCWGMLEEHVRELGEARSGRAFEVVLGNSSRPSPAHPWFHFHSFSYPQSTMT